jgi:hypothetical protein
VHTCCTCPLRRVTARVELQHAVAASHRQDAGRAFYDYLGNKKISIPLGALLNPFKARRAAMSYRR